MRSTVIERRKLLESGSGLLAAAGISRVIMGPMDQWPRLLPLAAANL
jgi:hypothetical protein